MIERHAERMTDLVKMRDRIEALTEQLEDAYARGFCAGQRALKDAGELVTIDSPEIRDRIEALTVERDAIFNVLSERDCEYNRKTNDMIERHAEQVKALTAERDTARAERDGLLRVVTDNHHALQRAEAAEKKLQEMQAHIDHADAYHTAMLVAEAETRMTMAELAAAKQSEAAAWDQWNALQDILGESKELDFAFDEVAALKADNARLQGTVDKCQSIAKDAVSMCNEGIPVSAKNVAMAVLRAFTGKETK
jgi:hypothetical protein